MARRALDLTGQKHGMLTAIRPYEGHKDHYGQYWICRCDCGKEIAVRASYFNTGNTKSCGCSKRRIKEEKT